jgi:uroporphyrinogen decarboxylase
MGNKGADTLQPEAANMAPAELAERFGSRLMFHGCISKAKIAAMNVEEVENEVCEILRIMMPNYGYCFAPTHMIQDNTPIENILAMYRVAREMGRYP